ncbi:YceI family protein [Algihabitans sp.]|uniref:YceI family protein n=1 Tax=Algihabitans sp. TaxID=2821514 RepID=UPI003BA8A3FD
MIRNVFPRTALLGAAAMIAVLAAPAAPLLAADTYAFDKSHTDVVFRIDHLGFSDTIGRFNDADGVIVLDETNPENSRVEVTIQAASLDTNHEERDGHLRGADFFNVEAHPTITFVSTAVERTGDETATVTGELTLLGVTQTVVLETTLNALKAHPIPSYEGVMTAGFSGTTTIKRSDFGMNAFVPAVGDEVAIILEIEAFKQ